MTSVKNVNQKCATLTELEMVLRAGARKAILSYPQLQERKVERFCDLTSSYLDAWIATIVSGPFHGAALVLTRVVDTSDEVVDKYLHKRANACSTRSSKG